MAAATLDIIIEQGATFSRVINYKDDDGNFIDISDATSVRSQMRRTYASSQSFAFTCVISEPTSGEITWTMDAATTASIPTRKQIDYIYDIELIRPDSVTRILEGKATISPEVTR